MFSTRWDRTKLFMAGSILVLEALVGGYFFIYLSSLKSAQATRSAAAHQDLDTVRNDAGQLTELRKTYETSRRTVAHLEPGTPADQQQTYLPSLLIQLQDLARKTGVSIDVMNPGTPKGPVNPPPPANGAATPAPAAPLPPAEVALPVALTLHGTFSELLAFIDGLKTFPKLVSVETLQLHPQASQDVPVGISPELGINMDITGTVLPILPEAH